MMIAAGGDVKRARGMTVRLRAAAGRIRAIILTRNAGPIISVAAEKGSDVATEGNIRAGVGSERNNVSLYYGPYDSTS